MATLLNNPLLDTHQLPQGHQRRNHLHPAWLKQRLGLTATDTQGEQFLRLHAGRARQLDNQVHVLFLPRHMQQIHRFAAHCETQGFGDRLGADPHQGGLFFVDDEAGLGLVGLDVPIDIHHSGCGLEDRPHLFGQSRSCLVRGPVNLSDQRLQDRRPRRHLSHGDPRPESLGHSGHGRPNPLGDVVTLSLPGMLIDQVDLDVGDVGSAAQKIVTDQAVEIEGRGHTHIHLIIGHLRLVAQTGSDLASRLSRALQRTPLRHVEDNLELRFIVEGQHLHRHPPPDDRGHGS